MNQRIINTTTKMITWTNPEDGKEYFFPPKGVVTIPLSDKSVSKLPAGVKLVTKTPVSK